MLFINEIETFLKDEINIFILVMPSFGLNEINNILDDTATNSFNAELAGARPSTSRFANQNQKLMVFEVNNNVTHLVNLVNKTVVSIQVNVADLLFRVRELRQRDITFCVKVLEIPDKPWLGTRQYLNRAAFEFAYWEPHKMYNILAENTIVYKVSQYDAKGCFAHHLLGDFVITNMSALMNLLNYLMAHDQTHPYIQAYNFLNITRERTYAMKDIW